MTSPSLRARRIASGTLAAALTLGALAFVATPATAVDHPHSETVYNSIPAHGAASHSSQAFAATETTELGDNIKLDGENRLVQTVTVGLNSWACESGGWNTNDCLTTPGAIFREDITVTFYANAGTSAAPAVGAELGTVIKTVDVPFRPSADPTNCPATPGKWFDGTLCNNGFTFDASFDFSGTGTVLTDDVIVKIAYPTHTRGGQDSGPADSLNVDLVGGEPSVGTDPNTKVMFSNSTWSGAAGAVNGEFSVTNASHNLSGFGLRLSITAAPAPVDSTEPAAYLNGLEKGQSGLSGITKAAYGAHGVIPAAGCFFAEAPVTNAGTATVFTKYAGYTTSFPDDGYTTDADFYLNAKAKSGSFDWSSAANGTDGNHQRDFVFTAGADGHGKWKIGVSNNAANAAPWVSPYSVTPLVVNKSGWYTFQHRFYEKNARLYVAMTVLDASGHKLAGWTLGGNAADKIPSAVGGNRYGWLVNNSYANLPIDNVRLNSARPSNGCAPFVDVSSKAGANYNQHATAITWMGVTGLSKGWKASNGKVFRPAAETSRAAMAEFFYRAAGSPAVALKKSPFIDVSKDPSSKAFNSHWKAIFWMYENGYAHGTHTAKGLRYGTLSPVTRGAIAAFMYRMADSPAVSPKSGAFVDVSSNPKSAHYSPFFKEIQWLSKTGLANGWSTSKGAEYRPKSNISRSAFAAFFYRAEFNLDS